MFIGLFGLISLQPAIVAADDPLFNGDGNSKLCSGDAVSSAVCQDRTDKNPLTGSDGLLIKIANIISWVAGAAAIIVILVSAIRYITSGGDAGKVSSAKGALINATIGLIVIILSRTLIVFILNRI